MNFKIIGRLHLFLLFLMVGHEIYPALTQYTLTGDRVSVKSPLVDPNDRACCDSLRHCYALRLSAADEAKIERLSQETKPVVFVGLQPEKSAAPKCSFGPNPDKSVAPTYNFGSSRVVAQLQNAVQQAKDQELKSSSAAAITPTVLKSMQDSANAIEEAAFQEELKWDGICDYPLENADFCSLFVGHNFSLTVALMLPAYLAHFRGCIHSCVAQEVQAGGDEHFKKLLQEQGVYAVFVEMRKKNNGHIVLSADIVKTVAQIGDSYRKQQIELANQLCGTGVDHAAAMREQGFVERYVVHKKEKTSNSNSVELVAVPEISMINVLDLFKAVAYILKVTMPSVLSA